MNITNSETAQNIPASPRQTFALFCATGRDFRSRNLSYAKAHECLSAISNLRNQKAEALKVVEDIISGNTPSVIPTPVAPKCPSFKEIYLKARNAGMEAAQNCMPTPMVVGTPTTPLGNDIDTNKQMYFVSEGVCGFAWIQVKPGTSAFAKWLKKNNLARPDSYYGGVSIWVGEFNQSMQRKEAYANAFANVLNECGIRAYSMSRMD
jgi:hypothetical protein